jgi:hypothetical protein
VPVSALRHLSGAAWTSSEPANCADAGRLQRSRPLHANGAAMSVWLSGLANSAGDECKPGFG